MTKAVFFDVDFTLIHPGPTFDGDGYQRFCARHGMRVDASRFGQAIGEASVLLDGAHDHLYDAALFIGYTRRIIEGMGGGGPGLEACAREIYDEWAACRHFSLYDDVAPALEALAARGLRLGLISNTHRCLDSLQSHFRIDSLISAAISSSVHGYMKPHPSIFQEGLRRLGARPDESVMVGDSLTHDVEGALGVGMRAILVHRSPDAPAPAAAGVPVVRRLTELDALL